MMGKYQVAETHKFARFWIPSHNDPPHLAHHNFFPVKSRFRVLDIIGLQKNIVKSSCGGGTEAYSSPPTKTDTKF